MPTKGLVCDLMWSDPDEVSRRSNHHHALKHSIAFDQLTSLFFLLEQDILGWGESDRGVSYTFGRDIVQEFMEANDITLICRAHQVVEDGYEFFNRRQVHVNHRPQVQILQTFFSFFSVIESYSLCLQLVTIFSAPNYCNEFDNAGGMLNVSEQLTCSFSIIPVSINMCTVVV